MQEMSSSTIPAFPSGEGGINPFIFALCIQKKIPGFRRDRAIIVGDSLSSDILGGINAGIATCWFNYRRRPARDDIRPDYTIDTLEELKSIL